MKTERKRIFISDLPETATENEVQKVFSDYGKVVSVEIKERKELGTKHSSLFFSYVNIEIDDKTLQQCFKDFANEKWLGQYVHLQLARESFLDRLKREREENALAKPQNSKSDTIIAKEQEVTLKEHVSSIKSVSTKKLDTSSEDSSSSSEDDEPAPKTNTNNIKILTHLIIKPERSEENCEQSEKPSEDDLQIIIKNNKNKTYDRTGLKIESFGKEPIFKIEKLKKKTDTNQSEANLKRLESLKKLKKGYQNQKSLIQAALSSVDTVPKNKIIFDDSVQTQPTKKQRLNNDSRKSLFDDNSENENYEDNFAVKEQFQGVEGQKLLELQSKYKNDKRFQLDSRFLDSKKDSRTQNKNDTEEVEDMTVEEEKRKEYEILNEVLGKKFTPKSDRKIDNGTQKKAMLRFDPSQPDHSKFEVKTEVQKEKKKRKKNNVDELVEEKRQEDREAPEVSKEVFYKVHNDLKESLQEKREFSLLNLFGKTDEKGDEEMEEIEEVNHITKNTFLNEKNPFRYDSSDDEDETKDIPNTENLEQEPKREDFHESNSNRRNFWVEPFFFTKDDYRLQEGHDFLEKMRYEERDEFKKLRRDIKQIVRAKVRNNQRNNKPFKKKLGGNKKKKMIRMKKAMKR